MLDDEELLKVVHEWRDATEDEKIKPTS
jgi:hypothetical protein